MWPLVTVPMPSVTGSQTRVRQVGGGFEDIANVMVDHAAWFWARPREGKPTVAA